MQPHWLSTTMAVSSAVATDRRQFGAEAIVVS